MLSSKPPVTVDEVRLPVPVMFVIRRPPSFTALPLFAMFIHDRLWVCEALTRMPLSVEFWIVPPVEAEPVPVTVRPPLVPVVLSTIPSAAPFDEMLLKFSPLAPIVVFATFSAVPVVVASVLFDPVTLTVPPPVALNAVFAPVEAMTPPVRLIVAPVLLLRMIPLPVDETAPPRVTVPAVRPEIATALPALVVIALPIVMVPFPLLRERPAPVEAWIEVFEPIVAELTPAPAKTAAVDSPDETSTRLTTTPSASTSTGVGPPLRATRGLLPDPARTVTSP